MQRIFDLLKGCGSDQATMPPTILFNEGWMLRLVLDWFDRHRDVKHLFHFDPRSRWYSEAPLRTQFRARTRGDRIAESWTHADGAIGHFEIGKLGHGTLQLAPDARQFTVVEAKMFSGLSRGTTNAPSFDQAARTIACMAEALCNAGREPARLSSMAFVVAAPAEQLSISAFAPLLDKERLRDTVKARVAQYEGAKDAWFERWFLPTVKQVHIEAMSWEDIVSFIETAEPASGEELKHFLTRCLEFNRRPSASKSEFKNRQSNGVPDSDTSPQ